MATSARSRSSNPARSNAARHTSEYHLPVTRTWRGANYAYPRGAGADRGKRPSYPIRPKSRARSARTRAAQRGTAGSLSHVDNAIRHVYGSVRAIYTGRGAGAGTSRGRTSSSRSGGRSSARTHASHRGAHGF
jgi:hypothetical protein